MSFFVQEEKLGKGPNCISVLLYCHIYIYIYVITLNDIVKPLYCTDILSLADKEGVMDQSFKE